MKRLIELLVLSCGIFCVNSQKQDYGNKGTGINQGQLYFADNRPTYRTNIDAVPERTTVDVQKSVEPQSQQDSYSQAALGVQNFGQFPVNPVTPDSVYPSVNLQPPQHNNDPNYYTGYTEVDDVGLRKGEAAGGTNLPGNLSKIPRSNNVSLAISNFGLNLLKNINPRAGNLVISPFSIAELLALLQQGAAGLTQQQISEALNMTPQLSVQAFKKINEVFQKSTNSRNILRVANNVYVADAFNLNPAFKRVAIQSFGSEVTPMQFSRSQEAVAKINQWVAQKTNNKIPELLSEDAVGDNTQLLMVNAIYFKGPWAVRFKPESTLPREFYLNDVAKKVIPFMRIRKIFRTGIDATNNAQVIILPFENEQYSLMVVMPSVVSTLDALVSTLTAPQLAEYLTFTPKEVDFEIPKFTVKADTDLNPVLRKMGVRNMFSQPSDLSGVGTYRTYSPQVSSALHSAVLSIDEDGGSAAAATSFAVVALSYDDPSITFKANRPFLAVLWDNALAVPLFMARIQDPTFSNQ